MLRYYSNDTSVVAVVPRTIEGYPYFLVCLRHKDAEANSLCEVAFQCMRQFVGISMLVKRRCFACHKPAAPLCKCGCACFCGKDCEHGEAFETHAKLCRLVQKSDVTVEEEAVELF